MKRVAALGMNNVSRKQLHEFRVLAEAGYAFDILTTDQGGDSVENAAALGASARCSVLPAGAWRRFVRVASYLWANRRDLSHVQIYPGGRYAFVYTALCRAFGVKTLTVEWGNFLDWDRHPALMKFSLWFCHRLADAVWYKEPYMERWLRRVGARRLFFIHNALPAGGAVNNAPRKKYDFLWVNRLIPQRRADWFFEVLALPEFAATRNLLIGVQDRGVDASLDDAPERALRLRPANTEALGFINPAPYYAEAKFFVLPATVVFCNNALLEAMGAGVVPIVSAAEGTALIVEDGVDGFVAEHSRDGLLSAMRRAAALAPEDYTRMSRAASRKVAEKFNTDQWREKILRVYDALRPPPGGPGGPHGDC